MPTMPRHKVRNADQVLRNALPGRLVVTLTECLRRVQQQEQGGHGADDIGPNIFQRFSPKMCCRYFFKKKYTTRSEEMQSKNGNLFHFIYKKGDLSRFRLPERR